MNAKEIRALVKSDDWISSPFTLLSAIAALCGTNIELAREFVIRALDKREFLESVFQSIVDELAMRVGLFPYAESLNKLSSKSAILHAAHRADGEMHDYVLHSSQARVLRKLLAGRSVILSAPTSFGKSLLIDILISGKKYRNIVLILPTLALVEETRRRMSRFNDRYSIITTSDQKFGKSNIFVFTQERFLSVEAAITDVDFFVIDEFYKLSYSIEGDRSTQLNQAFLKLLNSGAQFYLLGPSIKEIPKQVQEKLECSFIIEDFQTVAVEVHKLPKTKNRVESLSKLLKILDGQTLIYCQSPNSTRNLIKAYFDLCTLEITKDKELLEAAKWTAENYHQDWLVSVALKHGIGIHHGRLPRSLARFMVRAFEENKINILLCTSTLIEGVNTAAKNVIVYDNKLNNKKLKFFAFNNIKGRSGRMRRHFIGHVYVFDDPPQEDLPFVDFPTINPTETTPSSILIQLDKKDIPLNLREKVNDLLDGKLLPAKLLKQLSNIEPELLLGTASYLNTLPIKELNLLSWSGTPQYEDILRTSEIIWNNLGGAGSAIKSQMLSSSMMTKWIFDLYRSKNVPDFRRKKIDYQINERRLSPDVAVENVLAFLRNWASFNYPKYLVALSEIASYVMTKRGLKPCNYLFFATSIEHLFQPNSFSSLEEYGLPTELSEKFLSKRIFNRNDDFETIIKILSDRRISGLGEGVFERRVIEDFQAGIGIKTRQLTERNNS